MKQEFKSSLDKVLQILAEWGPIKRVDVDRAVIVGDIHGFPETLEWAVEEWRAFGGKLILLGDYVDRGPRGLNVLNNILHLLIENKEDIIPLRGNHESLVMNKHYGFYHELLSYGYIDLIQEINKLYLSLPYIAILNHELLLLHGGIPCRPMRLEDMETIISSTDPKYHMDPEPETLAFHILWNDPHGGIDECISSPRGAYYFGRSLWIEFLNINGLKAIVRGHEVASPMFIWRSTGDQVFVDSDEWGEDISQGSVYTIFTSLYHGGSAGILLYEKGSVRLKVYPGV